MGKRILATIICFCIFAQIGAPYWGAMQIVYAETSEETQQALAVSSEPPENASFQVQESSSAIPSFESSSVEAESSAAVSSGAETEPAESSNSIASSAVSSDATSSSSESTSNTQAATQSSSAESESTSSASSGIESESSESGNSIASSTVNSGTTPSSSEAASNTEAAAEDEISAFALEDAASDILRYSSPLMAFSASPNYKITEHQLFFQAPAYLNNTASDNYLTRCWEYASAGMDDISTADKQMASFIEGLKSGNSYIARYIASACGVTNDSYTDFNEKMAAQLVRNYLKVNDSLSSGIEDISKNFSKVEKVTSLAEKKERDAYVQLLAKAYPYFSASDWNKIVDKSWTHYFSGSLDFLGYVPEALDIASFFTAMIETYTMEITALDDLIAIQQPDSDLYQGLIALRYDLTSNPAEYVFNHYANDQFVKLAASTLKAGSGMAAAVVSLCVNITFEIYDAYNPSVQEITYAILMQNYAYSTQAAVNRYQTKFYNKTATEEDFRLYRIAYDFNIAVLKLWMEKAEKCTRNKRLKNNLQMWRESLGSDLTYAVYLNNCLLQATAAIDAGTLEVTEEGSIDKTPDGTVIDENYDSTESIAARFAVIQAQYPPNAGVKWNGYYGGSQCFGFVRLVFSKLFGCDMPSSYWGERRYELGDENNVVLVGRFTEGNVTAGNLHSLFGQAKLGDVIQACGSPYGQHSMMFVGLYDSGIVVYDCNWSNEQNLIRQRQISYDTLASYYNKHYSGSMGESTAGLSLYRAANYAKIYGNGDDLFFDDSINFVIDAKGVLIKYNGNQKYVMIPDTVTAIGANAFKNNTSMISVEIPDGVTSIGDSAFYGCSNLMGVVIPDSVETLGAYVFYDCIKMKTLVLPINEKFTAIENAAFYNCKSLNSVTIPDKVSRIGWSAFSDCSNLSQVHLPAALTTMSSGMFANCISLKTITLPLNLTNDEGDRYYETGPFYGCTNLINIIFEDGFTRVPSAIFQDCTSITTMTIPESVTRIESYAFYNCTKLRSVTLSNYLTAIGNAAFDNCKSLNDPTIPDTVTSVGAFAFRNCTNLSQVHLPAALTTMSSGMFANCTSLTSITLPLNLTNDEGNRWYDPGPFYGCTNLTDIIFEDGFTRVPSAIFQDCTSITTMTIPESVTRIESYAFDNCKSLKNITIPDKVICIGAFAFRDCTALPNITIPDSVTDIYEDAFSGCIALDSVTLPTGLSSIRKNTFYNCGKLKNVVIQDAVEKIAESAFDGCRSLENIQLPKSLATIDSYAFQNCSSLKSVAVPDNVTTINPGAFSGCTVLNDVTLGRNLTAIPQYAFSGNAELASIKIPNKVTSIGNHAFQNCTKLTGITIPRAVTSIGDTVFSYPNQLTIKGCANTYAETYANAKNIKFEDYQVHATSVSLQDGSFSVICNAYYQLDPVIAPADYTDEVIYKSANSSIATVDANGKVKGVSVGSTKIAVTVGGITAKCTVNVTQGVTSISLSKYSATLAGGDVLKLDATIYPSNANHKELQWSSSDEAIAIVQQDGTVSAISKGTAKITATAKDGSATYAVCNVVVESNLYVASAPEELRSKHPYENNCKDVWRYTIPSASSLKITFSPQVCVEEDFDFLYIFDKSKKQIGKYTGVALARATITVPGDTVFIQLDSDAAGNDYGFAVSSVVSVESPPNLGDLNGTGTINATDAIWLRQKILDTRTLTEEQLALADVNGSGTINATDVIWVKQRILGQRDENYKLVS